MDRPRQVFPLKDATFLCAATNEEAIVWLVQAGHGGVGGVCGHRVGRDDLFDPLEKRSAMFLKSLEFINSQVPGCLLQIFLISMDIPLAMSSINKITGVGH